MNDLKQQIEKITDFFNSLNFHEEILSIQYSRYLFPQNLIHIANLKLFKNLFKDYKIEKRGENYTVYAMIGECKFFCVPDFAELEG